MPKYEMQYVFQINSYKYFLIYSKYRIKYIFKSRKIANTV